MYLDWNSTAPVLPEVQRAMHEAEAHGWANPASVHRLGRAARDQIEVARRALGSLLGVNARDVVFTSGGTEANNMALLGAPALVTSRLEHPSVTRTAELLAETIPVIWLAATPSGLIDPEQVLEVLPKLPMGTVVAIQATNHETGAIQPISELALAVHRHGAWLHVDAVQAAGRLPPAAWRHGDSFCLAAHKLGGPKGIGALAWRIPRPAPKAALLGGNQERGLRPGTQNAVLAAGFRAAIEHAWSGPERQPRLGLLRDRMERELAEWSHPNLTHANRQAHVSSLHVPGWRADELVAALDLEGICISGGAACSAGSAEPSAVVTAMLGRERARGSVRVSLGETNTTADIDRAIDAFRAIVSRRRPHP